MKVYIVFDNDCNIDRIFLYKELARVYVSTEAMMKNKNWRQLADDLIEEHDVLTVFN